ncbi:MAG TPA: hypothetical protein VF451_02445 [Acidobacteriota bacterium]
MNKKMLVSIIMMTVLFLIPFAKLQAVSERTVVLGNVIGSSVSTLVRGLVQGEVRNFRDVARMLGYGAASGFGFYEAKKQVAGGHNFSGILLANLSASVIDNVTSGEGPLSYFGFTLPLVRIEIATPLAKQNRSLLRFTVSPRDAISLVMALGKSDRVSLRGGMLAFEADKPLSQGVLGWTYSIFPSVVAGTPDWVYRHEMVHVVQSLQMMASSPEPLVHGYRREEGKAKLLDFAGVRMQALGLANDLTLAKAQSYAKYWKEAEAYHLVLSK